MTRRVALKIDVDTFRGTRDGLPAMLADLDEFGVQASFFFTLGPDRSGRAVVRLLTSPSFLAKMLRTNAARMYGWRTALYGTLLPAPMIGRRNAELLRRVESAGHEVGLHAWDHRAWQDRLERRPRRWIDAQLEAGIGAFREVFSRPPTAFAAPAWMCTEDAFRALAARGFDYVSVSRGPGPPFFPQLGGETLSLLELPTTLPTFDEELGRDGVTAENYVARLLRRYRDGAVEVLTLHAESEGLAYREQFRELLRRQRELGIATLRTDAWAGEARTAAAPRRVGLGTIPGRSGRVAIALP